MSTIYKTICFNTNEASPFSRWVDGSLWHHGELSTKDEGSINQHLCVLSEDVKINDWVLCDYCNNKDYIVGKILKEIESDENGIAWQIEYLDGTKDIWEGYACKKIIATTINLKHVPKIKKSFILDYVMKEITDVTVEFEKDGSVNIFELKKENQLPSINECLKFAWDEFQKNESPINMSYDLLLKIINYSQGKKI